MKCIISFKQLEHTEALDSRIREKTENFCKFFHDIVDVKWVCYAKENNHFAEIIALGPKMKYHAKAKGENLYKCIDLVLMKLEKQLLKRKEIWKDKIHKNMKEKLVILDPEKAWLENDGEYHFEKMKKAS